MPRFRRATTRNTKVYGERGQQVMDEVKAATLYFQLQDELKRTMGDDRRHQITWAIGELEAEFPHLKED